MVRRKGRTCATSKKTSRRGTPTKSGKKIIIRSKENLRLPPKNRKNKQKKKK